MAVLTVICNADFARVTIIFTKLVRFFNYTFNKRQEAEGAEGAEKVTRFS
jgi:hypothetical protein